MNTNQLKITISILLSAILTFAIGLYGVLPWWSFVISNAIISIVIVQKPWLSFLTGALGVAIVWVGLAISIDSANNHILSTKVAQILPLGGSYIKLIVVTGIIGFLLGGLGSITGSFVRK
jgi:hypothetical protein